MDSRINAHGNYEDTLMNRNSLPYSTLNRAEECSPSGESTSELRQALASACSISVDSCPFVVELHRITRSWFVRLGAFATILLALSSFGAEPKTFRAARSVHLVYPASDGLLFYNELVVEQSVNGSYFMACGWNTGYFGIQQLDGPEDKVVLFSVWDPTKGDNPSAVKPEERVEVLYADDAVRIKRFGGEGTGGQCMWRHRWELGQTNRFMVEATVEDGKTAYTAWFRGAQEIAWKKLATFRTRTGGLPLRGYYSFTEDFRRDGRSAQQIRRARFGDGWIKSTTGDWIPLTRARFTASNSEWESPENIDAGVQANWFFLATGGDTRRTRELKSFIDLPGKSNGPPLWPAGSGR